MTHMLSEAPLDVRPPRRNEKISIKTYVILRRIYNSDPSRANVEVLDVKLTLAAAQQVKDAYAGTWIIRAEADKVGFLSGSPRAISNNRRK